MSKQLILDLPKRTSLGRGDFFISQSNALAVALIEDWQNWPNRKHILYGAKGSGKTHLSHVWAATTGAAVIPAADLVQHDVTELAQTNIVVDDLDQMAGDMTTEQAMFHLHNLIAAQGNYMLVTGRSDPSKWHLSLPDLASRLQGARAATLSDPDDFLFIALLAKLFSDRQLFPAPDVLQYLLTRCDRSFEQAQIIVDELDRQALAEHRNITRRFAAEVLDKLAVD